MKIRYLFYTAATIGLMSIGWYAHQVALYVQDVHANKAAKIMLANGLPVVK